MKKRLLALMTAASMLFAFALPASAEREMVFELDFESAIEGSAKTHGSVLVQDGVIGSCARFGDTSGNYISIGGANSSPLANKNAFSVSFFAYAETTDTTWWFYSAADESNPVYRYEKYIGILQRGTTLSLEFYNNSGSRNSALRTDTETGAWHHYAFTVDGGTVKLYKDGILADSVAFAYTPLDILGETPIIQLGKANWGSGEWAKGSIDELRIYDYAIDSAEVMADAARRYSSDEEYAMSILDTVELSRTERLTKNIELPKIDGCLTWITSDSGVVTETGVITRGASLASATLTARVSYNSATVEKAFNVSVLPMPTDEEYAYLFAYFISNSAANERLYYGVSLDGYNFKTLNGGAPILKAHGGTGCLRDPYIFKGEDGMYYCVATDMRSSTNSTWNGDTAIFVWQSEDLINWKNETGIDFSRFAGFEAVDRAWAPQVIWCPEKEAYMVYLALRLGGGDATVMYRTYTTDLMDFSAYSIPELFWPLDKSFAAIDGDIIYSEKDDCYYMYYKDESAGGIKVLSAANLSGVWSDTGITLPRANPSSGSTVAVEGSSIYKLNGEERWNLIVDAYASGFFIMEETEDLLNFTQLNFGEYSFDFTPRHGSVITISKAQYEALCEAFDTRSVPAESEDAMLRYTFENNMAKDVSGNGNDGALYGTAATTQGRNGEYALLLDGNGFAALPAGIVSNLEDVTFAAWINPADTTGATRIFDIGSGTTNNMFFTPYIGGTASRFAITTSGSSGEQMCVPNAEINTGEWTHIAITLKDNVASLYINGILAAENTETTLNPRDLGFTECNYIGKSNYSADANFKGLISDFRIYNRALDYGEISVLAEVSSTNIIGASGVGIKGYNTIIDTENKTVELTVYPGSDLSNVNVNFELQDAEAVVSPAGALDLTSAAEVTVHSGGQSQVWRITAVERGNSVLGEFGCFGDPNIVIMDGKYYIYPTTDGNTGWRSTLFKAFSSEDLVHWKDEGVILDFADVEWTGGIYAWAPTACERNGKYYYYYSGGTYNNGRSVGVAVADSPNGPFIDIGAPLVPAGSFSGQMIDPQVFIDTDGTPYLYWGNGSLYVAQLGDDMTSFVGEVYNITPSNFTEAIFVIKRNGKYYYTWSEGDTRSQDYRVRYGVADSPLETPVGNDVILSYNNTDDSRIMCTAHHSIINIPGTDEWYICYHRFNIPKGYESASANGGYSRYSGSHREVCIDRMYFGDDGSILPVKATMEGVMEPVRFTMDSSVVSSALERASRGDEISVTAYVQNNGEDANVQLICALYDKAGMMCSAQRVETTIAHAQGKSVNFTLTMPADFDSHTLKVMTWDEKIKPLLKAIERTK